jgi:hypothetical protein
MLFLKLGTNNLPAGVDYALVINHSSGTPPWCLCRRKHLWIYEHQLCLKNIKGYKQEIVHARLPVGRFTAGLSRRESQIDWSVQIEYHCVWFPQVSNSDCKSVPKMTQPTNKAT